MMKDFPVTPLWTTITRKITATPRKISAWEKLGIFRSISCFRSVYQHSISEAIQTAFGIRERAAVSALIALIATGAEARDDVSSIAYQACLKTYTANSVSKVDLDAANFACTCIIKEVRAHLDNSEFNYFEELEKLMASDIRGTQLSNELEQFNNSMGDSSSSGKEKFRRVEKSINFAVKVCKSKS